MSEGIHRIIVGWAEKPFPSFFIHVSSSTPAAHSSSGLLLTSPVLPPILRLIKEHARMLSPEVCLVSLNVCYSFGFLFCFAFFFRKEI